MTSFFKFRRAVHLLTLLAMILFAISLFVQTNVAFLVGLSGIVVLDFILLLISSLKYKVVTFSGNAEDIKNKKVFVSDIIMILFELLVVIGILQMLFIPILGNIIQSNVKPI